MKEAMKAITISTHKAYEKLDQNLGFDREKDEFRLAKEKEKRMRDIKSVKCVKMNMATF